MQTLALLTSYHRLRRTHLPGEAEGVSLVLAPTPAAPPAGGALRFGRVLRRMNRMGPLPPRRVFLRHLAAGVARGGAVLGLALGIGVLGYRFIVGLPWLDALLNAAMLLGGEGPLAPTPTVAGKLFASFYALFGGLVFVTVAGLLLAPALHRVLHSFHLEAGSESRPPPGGVGQDEARR